MSQSQQTSRPHRSAEPARSSSYPPGQPPARIRGAAGALFAATLMVIGGLFGVLQGIGYIVKGSFYSQPAHYWIHTNATTWGWWHLVMGVVVAAVGFAIISAAAWARWLGIVVVAAQAVTNFLFIPNQPFWATILILVDLWIIHSLFVYRGEYE